MRRYGRYKKLQRNENESVKDYKIRLCENKDLLGLTWQTIANAINKEAGENYTESSYRKWWASFRDGCEYQKRKSLDGDAIIKEYELKRIQFEKERQRFFDQRNSYSRMVRPDARHDELIDILQNTISEMENGKFEPIVPKIINSDNDLLVQLNDLHIGANVKNAWNTYNTDVCKKYLQQYIKAVYDIQATHNSKNCFVSLGGDLINGAIHPTIAIENKENVVQQVMVAAQLISDFIYAMCSIFENVSVAVVAGNHSRLGRKEESLYQERLDDLIPWYAKARLQDVNNVTFLENIDTTMCMMKIRGLKYVGVHGDYDNGRQALQSLNIMNDSDIYAVATGHRHHNLCDRLNKVKILMSGSMLGMDSYCIEKRIVGIPQQLVSVCDETGVVASYDVNFKQ